MNNKAYKFGHIRADYEEFKPETYRGIIVNADDYLVRTWNTGDYRKDVALAQAFCKEHCHAWGNSSSVADYAFDACIYG